MNTAFFKASDPISLLSCWETFQNERKSGRICEGAVAWMLSRLIREQPKAGFSDKVTADNNRAC